MHLRLRKEVYYYLGIIILVIIGSIFGINKYKEYKYHQTYEYKLISHGYSEKEAKTITKTLNKDKELNYYLEHDASSRYVELLSEKYFLSKNFYKYMDYLSTHKKLKLSDVVKNVNIHLDEEFYSTNYETDTSKDTAMLVNKYYLLSKDYAPSDLVTISSMYAWGENQQTRKVCYDAFLKMHEAALGKGYYLMVSSSYRSYADQETVYTNYEKKRGRKYADSIAARPGSSEHQTGLTLDIFSKTNSNKETFKDSEEAKWLAENSYKYGFILRYPENLVNTTGYNYESWHFRYVGETIATYIHENNISFEEYYAYYIEE